MTTGPDRRLRAGFRSFASRLAITTLAALTPTLPVRAAICDDGNVLTLLATDTRTGEFLFAMADPDAEIGGWLVRLNARQRSIAIHPDSLRGLRTGASHGPGPFLSASPCGADCTQIVEWEGEGWRPLGHALATGADATSHFGYDRTGAAWATFHRSTEKAGIVDVEAWSHDGSEWSPAGRLRVEAVGIPGARPDPGDPQAILVGTGRFHQSRAPEYWLPSLPALVEAPGGQLYPLRDAAAWVTRDSRVFSTADGGETWQQQRWAPWPNRRGHVTLWQAGSDYWIDLPVGLTLPAMPMLFYDDRVPSSRSLRLTRWTLSEGWVEEASLPREPGSGPPIEHVLAMGYGEWLLLGPCRRQGSESTLTAIEVSREGSRRQVDIPLSPGWQE